MAKPRIIIVHGNGGATGDIHWFPYAKHTLGRFGFTVITPTMPDNVLAREQYWLPFLKEELHADENTILIGHSSGAVAAMRYAEDNRLYGTVLVAACHTDLGDENERIAGYYSRPWQWGKIKANQNWIIQFHSTDDPAIPVDEARYVHKFLCSDYHEQTGKGHYNIKEFPELVDAVRQKFN